MLSKKDFERIVREMSKLRGGDAVEFLRKTSPWFDPLEPTIRRISEILRETGVLYVLHGFRALPLYGVPYISKEIGFAVKSEGGGLESRLRERGFQKLSGSLEESTFLDLQNNKVFKFLSKPRPLEWDDELVKRIREREGIRILSTEDYIVSLVAAKPSTMRLELAAKVIYSNMDELDRGYLEEKAAKLSVDGVIKNLISGLEEVSSR